MKYFLILFLYLAACATTQKDLAQQDKKSLSKIDGSKNSLAEIEPVQRTSQQPEIVLKHKYFTISYNSHHRLANWVRYSPKKAIAFKYNQKDKKQSPFKNQINTKEVLSAIKISISEIKDSSLSDWKECG